MDNQRHTLNKKSEHVYHYKIAGLVAGALFLGTLISAVLFLSGDKILHSYFETSDYLYRIETHRMYTLQNWVNENNISASDTDQLSEWMSQQNLSNMFIQRNDNSLFRNLSTKSFSSSTVFQIQSLPDVAKRNAHRIDFSDGAADVFIYEGFEQKYYIILFLSTGLIGILTSMLIFFSGFKKEINDIRILNQKISDIGAGSLDTPISITGNDEIAYLTSGIESMRVSLLEKEQHEQEMKQAQQRLVLGMAHDLRTPLATLLTDLELLKRQPSETDKLKYAERALTKTQEIRTLSDQLFEYFLASAEEPVFLEPCESAKYALGDYLSELYLYLSQEGFEVYAEELFSQEVKVRIHMEYMNRIINNIFSNIQKYADRQESIFFSTNRTDDYLVISFRNKIAAAPYSPSTGIGVKNIALMMQKMNGKMEQFADSPYYEIQLYFPICQDSFPSESTC